MCVAHDVCVVRCLWHVMYVVYVTSFVCLVHHVWHIVYGIMHVMLHVRCDGCWVQGMLLV